AHAELLAVQKAAGRLGDWRLSEWSVAVTLEPCPMCAGMLINARVGRLVYAAPDPKAGAVHSLYAIASDQRLNHRVDITAGVLAGLASARLRTFFRERRHGRGGRRNHGLEHQRIAPFGRPTIETPPAG
ncbi:MAG: nucleoside deaminase, partial [Planctomycetota bacterium]